MSFASWHFGEKYLRRIITLILLLNGACSRFIQRRYSIEDYKTARSGKSRARTKSKSTQRVLNGKRFLRWAFVLITYSRIVISLAVGWWTFLLNSFHSFLLSPRFCWAMRFAFVVIFDRGLTRTVDSELKSLDLRANADALIQWTLIDPLIKLYSDD